MPMNLMEAMSRPGYLRDVETAARLLILNQMTQDVRMYDRYTSDLVEVCEAGELPEPTDDEMQAFWERYRGSMGSPISPPTHYIISGDEMTEPHRSEWLTRSSRRARD